MNSVPAKITARLLTGLCVLLMLGCTSSGGNNQNSNQTNVPNVVGQTQAAAEASIAAAGLTVGVVASQSSDTVPDGDVINQDPAANTQVGDGSAVNVVVSTGPASVTVPDVVGLSQAQATIDISVAGLLVGAVTQQSDNTVPAGDVISQDPASASMVAPGSSVDLVISLGPATIAAPDVVGLSQAQANVDIVAAGLAVGTAVQQNDDVTPAGDVVIQEPVAGTMLAPGQAVDLVISLGPAVTPVPGVVGLSEAQAGDAITTTGLVIGTVTRQSDDTVPAGNIIAQDPTAGTLLTPGSAVDLVISLGPPTVPAPNVVGLSQAQAIADIVGAGLVVGTVNQQSDNAVPAGDVISQDPISGTMVVQGSAIDLLVSLGPGMISVPNVVGLSTGQATADIVDTNLILGTVSHQNHATVPAGDVISQLPVGGTLVNPGSSIDLVVSLGPGSVAVPNVVELTEADAMANIGAAGLAVGTVMQQTDDTVLAGKVISQDPAAGTTVALGSAVNLVVSLGPV